MYLNLKFIFTTFYYLNQNMKILVATKQTLITFYIYNFNNSNIAILPY